MFNVLKQAMETKTLLSVYPSESDADTFYVGYVYEVNENTMLMKLITTKGYESGFVTFFVDDIQKITMDGFYEKRIARLMKEYDLSYEELDKIPTTGNPIRDIIAYAQNKKTILTIITDNNGTIFSKNMELHNDYIFAEVYNEYGHENGRLYLNNDRIFSLCVESDAEKILQTLLS